AVRRVWRVGIEDDDNIATVSERRAVTVERGDASFGGRGRIPLDSRAKRIQREPFWRVDSQHSSGRGENFHRITSTEIGTESSIMLMASHYIQSVLPW